MTLKKLRIRVGIAVVLVAAVALTFSLKFPGLWELLWIPWAFLAVFQVVALGNSTAERRKSVFVVTDWVYYGVLGGGVFLATLFLTEGARLRELDNRERLDSYRLERESIEARMPQLSQDLENSRRAYQAYTGIDQKVTECLLLANVRAEDPAPARSPQALAGECAGALAVLDAHAHALSEFRRHSERKIHLDEEIPRLEDALEEPGATEITRPEHERARLVWVPILALVAFTLKLAKTTHGYRELRRI